MSLHDHDSPVTLDRETALNMAADLMGIRQQLDGDAHAHLIFALDEVIGELHDRLFPDMPLWSDEDA